MEFIMYYISTTEVHIRTGKLFFWDNLWNFCKKHNLPIPKKEYSTRTLNEYPAIAWLTVYGLDITNM